MNSSRFDLFMTSIDDSLLEEALQPQNSKLRHARIITRIAACLCLLIGGSLFLRPYLFPPESPAIIAEDLLALEYNLPDLEGHSYEVTYHLYENSIGAPVAEAVLVSESDTEYVVRSLRTDTSTDLSGFSPTGETLLWAYGPLQFELCRNDSAAWLNWYSDEMQLQYCIFAAEDSVTLLQTAADIVSLLGYDMAVAPKGATDIRYLVFLSDGHTIAETSFTYQGLPYTFRMASTMEISVPFGDISGKNTDYNMHRSLEVLWCPAELYLNYPDSCSAPNAGSLACEGKLIWFDVVPGLLYSLTCQGDVSEEMLISMAESLFRPAQEGN